MPTVAPVAVYNIVIAIVNVHALAETVPANTQVIGILPVIALITIISVTSLFPTPPVMILL